MIKKLSYYKKLNFSNILSWPEKDIAQFLIWDYMDTMKEMDYNDIEKLLVTGYQTITQEYSKYKLVIDFVDKFIKKIYIKNKKNKKILFYTIKYPLIISESKKHYSLKLMVRRENDRFFAIKNLIGYISINDLNKYVYAFLTSKKIKELYKLIEGMKEKLKIIKPNFIVLYNDSLPIERAIVLVGKKLGITTLVIQHGIYNSNVVLSDGRVADYILVWGQYWKNLYINQGLRKPEDIYILGYPHSARKFKIRTNKKNNTLYYLGQNFEQYNKNLLNTKIKTINALDEICSHLNIKFVYKTHPGDNIKILKTQLPKICFTPKNEKITETFNRGDIFVSFSSTALIEASLYGKISLQLMNYSSYIMDNWEKLGACTKSFQTIHGIESYLKNLIKSPKFLKNSKFKFNEHYVKTHPNPCKRFLEILDDIENRQKN